MVAALYRKVPMFKPTPNPPETGHAKSKAKKHDEAAKRALDHYLLPKPEKSEDASQPGQLFTVAKNADNESLLANLSETLADADTMVSNLAFDLEGPARHILQIGRASSRDRVCTYVRISAATITLKKKNKYQA